MTEHANDESVMTAEEAVRWLREVDGELYRTRPGRRGREAWVAVVRAPQQTPKMIVALGETLQEAASAAALQWRESFRATGTLH